MIDEHLAENTTEELLQWLEQLKAEAAVIKQELARQTNAYLTGL